MSIGKLSSVNSVGRDTPLAEEKIQKNLDARIEREAQKDPRVYDASKMYEKYFLGEMVKAMRATVSEGGLMKSSMTDKIFKDQLDDQYVDKWTEKGGVGLADMIYEELMTKVLNATRPAERPSGPIALSDRDVSRVQKMQTAMSNQTAMRVELKPTEVGAGPGQIKAPWDSKVLTTTKVDGKTTVLLEHDGGVRSALIFDGVPTQLKPGQTLKKGDALGVLNPEVKSFFWNVSQPAKTSGGGEASDQAKIAQGQDSNR